MDCGWLTNGKVTFRLHEGFKPISTVGERKAKKIPLRCKHLALLLLRRKSSTPLRSAQDDTVVGASGKE